MDRLSEDVKREISAAVREIKDPRVSGAIVSVSRVELTNDLSYCKVYVSALKGTGTAEPEEENPSEEAVKALANAAGFFKKRLNARLRMRKLPELIFLPDPSLDYYDKISRMIDNLPKPAQADEPGRDEPAEQERNLPKA